MKKLLLGTATAIVIAAPAQAADLPVKAPPAVAVAVATWTGCYIGANVGYTWARSRASNVRLDNPPFAFLDFDFDDDGVSGGVQAGCNWQTGRWVFGIEADAQLASVDAGKQFDNALFNSTTNTAFDTDVRSSLKWFGTARGRLGWTVTPTTLFYVTGGFAFAKVRSTLHFPLANGTPTAFSNSDTNNHRGWTAGAGIEAKLAQSLSAKLEYLYVDLSNESYAFLVFPTLLYRWDQRVNFHTVRIGLNYQFTGTRQ